MRTKAIILTLAVLALGALPAGAASSLTARASGVLAVHLGPYNSSPIIDKLKNGERVRLDQCTRKARWCHVIQLDGGPSGWVDGSYLVGSGAKNVVTPFEFSFDPLWPRGMKPLHP